MSIKGFQSDEKRGSQNYATVQNMGNGRFSLDVVTKSLAKTSDIASTITTVNIEKPKRILNINAHGMIEGDKIRFNTGLNAGVESSVKEIIDINNIEIDLTLPNDPSVGDEVFILRPVSTIVDSDGNSISSQGPLKFVKDAADVEVTLDTVDSNNNIGLPVEIVSASGDINLTAGDINVQLSHNTANPDSTQIGDGTNLLGITASNEAKTSDADTLAKLVEILAKIIASPATEAKQDSNITELTAIKDKLLVAPATEAKQDTTISSIDAITAKLIAAPSTEAKQTIANTALADILAKISADPSTETTLSLLNGKVSTEAKQDTILTSLGSLLTELELKADLTETQPVSLASQPLPTGATTATVQNDILTTLGLIKDKKLSSIYNDAINPSTTPIPAAWGSAPAIVNSMPAACTQIDTVDDIGEFTILMDGSANFIGYPPLGGGSMKVDIAAGTEVRIVSLTGSTINTDGLFCFNFLG